MGRHPEPRCRGEWPSPSRAVREGLRAKFVHCHSRRTRGRATCAPSAPGTAGVRASFLIHLRGRASMSKKNVRWPVRGSRWPSSPAAAGSEGGPPRRSRVPGSPHHAGGHRHLLAGGGHPDRLRRQPRQHHHRQPQRRRQASWSTAAPSPIMGGTPTVANTALIQVFGQGGNDTITLERSQRRPAAGQPLRRRRQRHAHRRLRRRPCSSARPATTPCSARAASTSSSAAPRTTRSPAATPTTRSSASPATTA